MDESIKKKVLQLFPSPIFIVGCGKDGVVHAFGGSWLGQCSFKPPMVWIAVRNETRPQSLLEVGGYFTVNVLRSDQESIARVFFKTPEPKDGKFGTVAFHQTDNGMPVLDEALAWVECRITGQVTPGDHTLYFGEVMDCGFCSDAAVLTTVNSGLKYGG